MKKTLHITLLVLIVLTLISAIVSNKELSYTVGGIIILAVLKFIGVSFYFMELKKANIFWKASILIFLMLFSTVILISI